MKIEVLNVYSNEATKGSDLKGDHGQSFLITTPDEKILFDTGAKGKILLHNMSILEIHPDDIDKVVFSHGHFDHTGGFPAFLDSRTKKGLKVYAHPLVREKKTGKIGPIKIDLGFPKLTNEQEDKIEFIFSKEPIEISPCIKTTGEITNRPEVDGTEPKAMHDENGKLVVDPVLDDLSLVLDTKDGLAIIAGCAHSGILNILNSVKKTYGKKISTIVGGTHMVSYTENEVVNVADILKTNYSIPDLYLNHCTDKLPIPFVKKTKALDIIKKYYTGGLVNKCLVGSKLEFKC